VCMCDASVPSVLCVSPPARSCRQEVRAGDKSAGDKKRVASVHMRCVSVLFTHGENGTTWHMATGNSVSACGAGRSVQLMCEASCWWQMCAPGHRSSNLVIKSPYRHSVAKGGTDV
jgi:hypothetical protein